MLEAKPRKWLNACSSVQFSHLVVSDSLWPHGLRHARLPCPSPTPGPCSDSCLLSRWCHPTVSSSVIPFSCPQSFPAPGSSQRSQVLGCIHRLSNFPITLAIWCLAFQQQMFCTLLFRSWHLSPSAESWQKEKRHLLEYIYFNPMLAWFEQRWECQLLNAVDNQICISETKSWLLNLRTRATIHFLPESKMPDQGHRDEKHCRPRNCGWQDGYGPSKYYKYQFSRRVRAVPGNQQSSMS